MRFFDSGSFSGCSEPRDDTKGKPGMAGFAGTEAEKNDFVYDRLHRELSLFQEEHSMKKITAILTILALLLALSVPAAFAEEEAGTMVTAALYDISTMDVAHTTDNYLIPMNVFDRLFESRPENGASKIVNSLCTDYSVSEDGKTYNFTLKDGVVFSNGSTLTASDVKYSFERLLKIADQNTDIPLEVVGGEAVMKGEADSLEGFTVTDDTHFSVTLNKANAGFVAELSAPAMSIVDAETTEQAKSFGVDPADTIGTGPYIVTEWVANDHYTLVYNPKYQGEEPSVKKLVVKVIPDANTQNLMYQNGELDLIDLKSMDSMIVENTYKTQYADRIVSTPEVGLVFVSMNENNQYLKDVNVRKAVGMAIDIDSIIKNIYNGNAKREYCIIPSGVWGHNGEQTSFPYDPEQARKLLQEAGYKDGDITFEFSMDSTTDSNNQLVYQFISQELKKVGINANIKAYDHSAYLAKRNSGEMDCFIARWGMDYNDPANIMFTFFGNEQNSALRSENYPNTEVMARVAAASAIVDDDEREKEYQALDEKIIVEDAAWVPMYSRLHLYCMGERVQSFTPQWAGFTDFYATDVVLK